MLGYLRSTLGIRFEMISATCSCRSCSWRRGGGLHYAMEGMTHHAIEDIALTRAMPGLTVLAPGDPVECEVLIRAAIEREGPSYLKLGGNGNPVVYPDSLRPMFGKISCLQPVNDVAIIANGEMLIAARQAVELLQAEGVTCRLHSIHTLKPIDEATIRAIARDCRCHRHRRRT